MPDIPEDIDPLNITPAQYQRTEQELARLHGWVAAVKQTVTTQASLAARNGMSEANGQALVDVVARVSREVRELTERERTVYLLQAITIIAQATDYILDPGANDLNRPQWLAYHEPVPGEDTL